MQHSLFPLLRLLEDFLVVEDEENNKIALSIREALPKAPKVQHQHNNGFKPREHKNNYEPRGSKQPAAEASQPKEHCHYRQSAI